MQDVISIVDDVVVRSAFSLGSYDSSIGRRVRCSVTMLE